MQLYPWVLKRLRENICYTRDKQIWHREIGFFKNLKLEKFKRVDSHGENIWFKFLITEDFQCFIILANWKPFSLCPYFLLMLSCLLSLLAYSSLLEYICYLSKTWNWNWHAWWIVNFFWNKSNLLFEALASFPSFFFWILPNILQLIFLYKLVG